MSIFSSPWFWVALYGTGFFLLVGILGPGRSRVWIYNHMPKGPVMAFMLIFMILPPIGLPFTKGPRIGMPWWASIGLGTLLFIANLVIKILSQRMLGVMPAVKKKDALVTTGMYNVVRHPLYMSNGLMAAGLALLMDSLPALFFSIPYSLAFLVIIHFEETILINQYGDQYQTYQQKVPWRIIPGII